MNTESSLKRFIDAQHSDYSIAFSEIKRGRKVLHWMWYIFPQIQGLGFSEASRYYAIVNLKEAEEYLQHPVLGTRLINICQALLGVESTNANKIFGSPDDLKLKSSMTLFASISDTNSIFQKVLDRFFAGAKDRHTCKFWESRRCQDMWRCSATGFRRLRDITWHFRLFSRRNGLALLCRISIWFS